jgi:hypothetical protein
VSKIFLLKTYFESSYFYNLKLLTFIIKTEKYEKKSFLHPDPLVIGYLVWIRGSGSGTLVGTIFPEL